MKKLNKNNKKVIQSEESEYETEEEEEINEENKQNTHPKQKITLYDLLDVPKSASIIEIKKAYKNLNDPTAKESFQKIQEAYNILSNTDKKAIYDQTGSYGDDFNEEAFSSAYDFYRAMYKKVEKQDIEDYAVKYRNSLEEEEDLINFYQENEGNITKILHCIPLSRNEDIQRFIQKYEELIEKQRITKYKIFEGSQKKIKKLNEKEDVGLEEATNEYNLTQLAKQIQGKQQGAVNFLDMLEQKYAPKQKVNKKTQKQPNYSPEQENLRRKIKK